MAQVTRLDITNVTQAGTAQITRFNFTLTLEWTDDNGVQRTHGPQAYTFPGDLTAMPVDVRLEFAKAMITAAARVAIGVDTWDQYR